MEIILNQVDLPNGETLAYRKRPGGDETLVLLHGNMSSSLHWDLVMENFPEEYTIYAPDLRGFGESSYRESIDSMADFAQDIKLFCNQLELDDFQLVGWSTGGGVAMKFAANYQDYIQRLILLESVGPQGFPIYKKDEQGQPIYDQLLTSKEEIAADPIQVKPILEAYEQEDKETMKAVWNSQIYTHQQPEAERYDHYLEEMFKQRNLVDVDYALVHFNISFEDNGVKQGTGEIAEIEVPTLVLWGENDQVVSEEMAVNIKEGIGDNAQLVYLENCGHSPLTDDLEKLLTEITSFLSA